MIWGDNFLKIAYHPSCATELQVNVPLARQDLKIRPMGGKTELPHKCCIRIMIMSCPRALFGSRIFIILAISALVTGIDESFLVVFYVEYHRNFTCIFDRSALLGKKIVK